METEFRKKLFKKYSLVFYGFIIFGQSILNGELKSSPLTFYYGLCVLFFNCICSAICLRQLGKYVRYRSEVQLTFDRVRVALTVLTVAVGFLECCYNRALLESVFRRLERVRDLSRDRYFVGRGAYAALIFILLSSAVFNFSLDSFLTWDEASSEMFVVVFSYHFYVLSINLIGLKSSLFMNAIGSLVESSRCYVSSVTDDDIEARADKIKKILIYQKELTDARVALGRSLNYQLALLVLTSFLQATGTAFAAIKATLYYDRPLAIGPHPSRAHHYVPHLRTLIDLAGAAFNVITVVRAADYLEEQVNDPADSKYALLPSRTIPSFIASDIAWRCNFAGEVLNDSRIRSALHGRRH